MPVVLGAVLDQLNRSLQVIQETVHISQENLDVTAGLEELGEFHDLLLSFFSLSLSSVTKS